MTRVSINSYVGRKYLSILLGGVTIFASSTTFMLPPDIQWVMTVVLVILSVLFAFIWCWPISYVNKSTKIDFFHPSFLFIGFYLIYFVFSGFLISFYYEYRSNWVDLGSNPEFTVNKVFILGIISVAAFGLGMRTRIKLPGNRLKALLYCPDIVRRAEAKYVIVLFLIIGCALSLYHLSLFGSLSFDLFRYLSPTAQQELGIGWNNVLTMIESMLLWGALIALFFFLLDRRSKDFGCNFYKSLIFILLFLGIGILIYTITGKRSAVIPLLLLPIAWRHYLIRQLNILYMLISFAIIVVVIGLLLTARIVVPLIGQEIDVGNQVGESIGDMGRFYMNTPELATFDMVVESVSQRESLLKEMGGPFWAFIKYNFGTLLLTFVPPGVWADKPPYEDPGHKYFQLLTGSNENVGFAVTVWGTSFLFLHILGIIIGMIILGWFFNGMYNLFRPWERRPFDVFFYSIFYWMAFQFLRFGTLGFTFIYFVSFILIGVLAALFIARNRFSFK